jgi:hypothetical protein
MNTNLLTIVKQIIASNGEGILNDPRRLKAFFDDLAKDEPKPLRIAFGRCIEEGAYTALKTAPDAADRASRKTAIAGQILNEHGLDITLCGEALDILEAALYGKVGPKPPPPRTIGMPSRQEIIDFFAQNHFYLHGTKYLNPGVNGNRITFQIHTTRTEYIFQWETDDESRASFVTKFPKIKKLYPDDARMEIGGGHPRHLRIFIDVDQANPLADSLDIVNKTKRIMGYP